MGHTLLYKIGINTLISDPVHNNACPIYFNLVLDDFFHLLNSDQLTANIAKGRRTQGLSAFVSEVILQVQQIQLQKLDQT